MQWFKHDTGALSDAKIKKLIIRQGPIGYAVYFHCLELIAGRVDASHLTYELEHDSEIIADNLRVQGTADRSGAEIVEGIMREIVALGLFTEDGGRIYCLKMAARMDKSMMPRAMRDQVEANASHGRAMAEPAIAVAEPAVAMARIEENRIDKNRTHTQEARETSQEVALTPSSEGIPALAFPDGYAKAVYEAWGSLGDKVYQPANFMAFGTTWREVRDSLRGIHSDDVLAAIANLGSVLAAPPGVYWWTRKVGLRAFIKEHLEKFMPSANPLDSLKADKLEDYATRKARQEEAESREALRRSNEKDRLKKVEATQ